MAPLLIALIVLLPAAQGYVLVYAKGFEYRWSYGEDTYVRAGSVEKVLETWRGWGYRDLRASGRIDPGADGIIVLGCTELEEDDLKLLEDYVKRGGRLVLDLYCPGRLDDFMYRYGVTRSGRPYRGVLLQRMVLPYAEVRGYPVDRPIIAQDTPVNSRYAGMVYSGPAFTITGDTFSDAFITPTGDSVAFTAEIGKGKVYATGCLLCSNQLLMANVLDWVSDGRVDFPRFEVDRRVYPPVKEVGKPFYDELRVSLPPEEKETLDVSVAYPYNEEGFCRMVPVQERKTEGSTVVFRFEYTPQEKVSCSLAPVLVSMTWVSPKGKVVREFTVPGEYVQVVAPPLYVPPSALPYVALALLAVLAGLAVLGKEYHKRKKISDMKLRLKVLEEGLKELHKKLMTRQITEDVYKKLVERYVAEMEELRAKIKIMEGKNR